MCENSAKTDLLENVNDQVAKACELRLYRGRGRWENDVTSSPFHPDSDIAAAMFAAKEYSIRRKVRVIQEIHGEIPGDSEYLYSCRVWKRYEQLVHEAGPTPCIPICKAIIEAEKVRTKSNPTS